MRIVILSLLALTACAKQPDKQSAQQLPARAAEGPSIAAAQSPMPAKAGGQMKEIPIPKDKAQLARLVSIGYTIHEDHMHPPGVKSCPLDKNGGSVVE